MSQEKCPKETNWRREEVKYPESPVACLQWPAVHKYPTQVSYTSVLESSNIATWQYPDLLQKYQYPRKQQRDLVSQIHCRCQYQCSRSWIQAWIQGWGLEKYPRKQPSILGVNISAAADQWRWSWIQAGISDDRSAVWCLLPKVRLFSNASLKNDNGSCVPLMTSSYAREPAEVLSSVFMELYVHAEGVQALCSCRGSGQLCAQGVSVPPVMQLGNNAIRE